MFANIIAIAFWGFVFIIAFLPLCALIVICGIMTISIMIPWKLRGPSKRFLRKLEK